ncbi:MAG: class I SAM-dependent methyltransferase [Gammaproteobacteria bacterium]|nr:class I SAM-dependent methyltransferase [Gammaproteobacteria bacterium]
MSTSDLKQKWDSRYKESEVTDSAPAAVLQENLHLLPSQGNALDLACGLGANAVLLAQNNLNVTAWDISEIAIDKLNQFAVKQNLNINAQARNIESCPPEKNSFDVIVVAHFLERSLIQQIIDALKPGGLLFYQTFTQARTSDRGPDSVQFRLAENELLSLFSGLSTLVYREEGITGDTSAGFRDEAMLIAKKP